VVLNPSVWVDDVALEEETDIETRRVFRNPRGLDDRKGVIACNDTEP